MGTVIGVQVGGIAPLGPGRVPSGFVKHTAADPVAVGPLGLDGDEQADLTVHGGPEKAVYGYGAEAYATWLAAMPEHAALLVPGGMGENLTISGQDEASVHIGDIYRIGTAILQVCQPRQPCFKFALRFVDRRMPRAMTRLGLSGWYFRVIEPGAVRAGDAALLVERPNPGWPMRRFNALLAGKTLSSDERAELSGLPGLASQWR